MTALTNKPFRHKAATVILWLLLALPFVTYSLCVIHYSTNTPIMDDYDAVLDFTSSFINTQTPVDKISLLFSQHNEHRIVFDRVVFLGYYYLFREVDFRFFIIFGNLGWILTVVMLVVYVRNNFHLPLSRLLPIPYILLSFSHWENMFCAMAAIQNYWFVFFAVAFLISLSKDNVLMTGVLFPLALFTSGGGIVLYPLGNLFFLLRKKRQAFWSFFATSTTCMLLYFFNYHKPSIHPGIVETIVTPFSAAAYYFSFWGNLWTLPLGGISLLIGLIICSLSFYLAGNQRADRFLRLAICFIALVALAITLARSGFGVQQAMSSKYSLFPLLALACMYLFMITPISSSPAARRTFIMSSALIAVSFWGISVAFFVHNDFFSQMKIARHAGIAAFRNGDTNGLFYPDKERAGRMLLTADQQHIYHYRGELP